MSKKQTHANETVWLCATPDNDDLDLAGFGGKTYVQAKGCLNAGNWSTIDNIIGQDLLDEPVTSKQKGSANGGDPQMTFASNLSDAGQTALRAAAETNDYYAFKMVRQSGEIIYNRGVVSRPDMGDGERETFLNETFTVGFVQETIRDATGV